MPKTPTALSIRLKILLGFGLALLTVAVVAIVTYRTTCGFIRANDAAAQTRELIEAHEMFLRHLSFLESSALGFVVTGDEHQRLSFSENERQILASYNALHRNALDDQ